MSMKLNFSGSGVSSEVLESVRKEQAKDRQRALAERIVEDERKCQAIVDAGRKHLATLRKRVDDFLKLFKELESDEALRDPAAFMAVALKNDLNYHINGVFTTSVNYDEVREINAILESESLADHDAPPPE